MKEKSNSKSEAFEKNARNLKSERESVRIGDPYVEMYPLSMPKIDNSMVGKRLDICEQYSLEEGGNELR